MPNITLRYLGNAKGAVQATEQLKTKTDRLGKQFASTRGSASKMDKAMSQIGQVAKVAAAGFAVLGAAALRSVQQFSKYETALAEVTTLFDSTPEITDQITASLQKMATYYGADQTSSAKTYYQIVSAGAEAGTEANQLLEVALKASVAGVTDATTAADALTNVMNAYGLSGAAATTVSDQLFAAVKAGKTTFEELGANVGKVAPVAASAGVAFEEVSAAIANITSEGVTTSESVTQIKALIQSLLKPTKQAAELQKELNVEWNAAALESKGLQGVIEDLSYAAGDNKAAVTKMLGSIEAYQAYAVLAKNNSKDFAEQIYATANAAGSTEEAFAKMSQTVEFQYGRVKATLSTLTISVGGMISEWIGLDDVLVTVNDAMVDLGYEMGLLDVTTLNARQQVVKLHENITEMNDALHSGGEVAADVAREYDELWDAATMQADSVGNLQIALQQLNEQLAEAEAIAKRSAGQTSAGIAAEREIPVIKEQIALTEELIGWAGAYAKAREDQAAQDARELERQNARAEALRKQAELEEAVGQVVAELTRKYEPQNEALEKNRQQTELVNEAIRMGVIEQEQATKVLGWLNDEYVEMTTIIPEVSDSTKRYLAEVEKSEKASFDFQGALRDLNQDLLNQSITIDEYNRVYAHLIQLQNDSVKSTEAAAEAKRTFMDVVTETLEEIRASDQAAIHLEEAIAYLEQQILNGADATGELQRALDALTSSTGAAQQAAKEFEWISVQSFSDVFGPEFFDGFSQSIGSAIVAGYEHGSEAFERSLTSSLQSTFGSAFADYMGGALGNILGPLVGNIVGKAVGQSISDVGRFFDQKFFSGRDRVTVGVNATRSIHSAFDNETRTAASGLQLTAQQRGAGDAGRDQATRLLEQLMAIDLRLYSAFERLAESIDFSDTELRPDRPKSELRPSDTHAQFGSVRYDEVSAADLEDAGRRFAIAWLEAALPSLSTETQTLVKEALASNNVDEIIAVIEGHAAEIEQARAALAAEELEREKAHAEALAAQEAAEQAAELERQKAQAEALAAQEAAEQAAELEREKAHAEALAAQQAAEEAAELERQQALAAEQAALAEQQAAAEAAELERQRALAEQQAAEQAARDAAELERQKALAEQRAAEQAALEAALESQIARQREKVEELFSIWDALTNLKIDASTLGQFDDLNLSIGEFADNLDRIDTSTLIGQWQDATREMELASDGALDTAEGISRLSTAMQQQKESAGTLLLAYQAVNNQLHQMANETTQYINEAFLSESELIGKKYERMAEIQELLAAPDLLAPEDIQALSAESNELIRSVFDYEKTQLESQHQTRLQQFDELHAKRIAQLEEEARQTEGLSGELVRQLAAIHDYENKRDELLRQFQSEQTSLQTEFTGYVTDVTDTTEQAISDSLRQMLEIQRQAAEQVGTRLEQAGDSVYRHLTDASRELATLEDALAQMSGNVENSSRRMVDAGATMQDAANTFLVAAESVGSGGGSGGGYTYIPPAPSPRQIRRIPAPGFLEVNA